MKLADHPTVRQFHEKQRAETRAAGPAGEADPPLLDAAWLRQLALGCGADDAGLVEIGRPALDDQRRHSPPFPACQNTAEFRLPDESGTHSQPGPLGGEPGISRCGGPGQRSCPLDRRHPAAPRHCALNPAMGFPMEMDKFPAEKIWVVSHKPVAVAAGLGMMGIHRNVIHPKFGNFILLGTVLIDAAATGYDRPIDYNPCLECKLCVAACPVGAIAPDGAFNFSACYTHNYREFMGGFTNWVEQIAASNGGLDYRQKVTDQESASMWQSLSFGPNYKAAYCLSVCPAGEDVIGPYLTNKAGFLPGRATSAHAKRRDDLRRPRLGRRGARGSAFSAQEYQTHRQRLARADDRRVLAGTSSFVSAGPGDEPAGGIPLYVQRQRNAAGDRRDRCRNAARRGRPSRRRRPAHYGR